MKKLFMALAVGICLLASPAVSTTLAWDPNPIEEQVTQYNVHWGAASGAYTNTVPVVSGTEYTFADGTFLPGSLTYLAVTAENSAGLVSDYSNEVILDLRGPEFNPPTAPTNVTITATRNLDGSVTITLQ